VQSGNVLVKTYKGSEADATLAFQKDAGVMAANGWYPTSQSYAPGSYGCGAFLVALLLCFVVIGVIVFIYMLLVKPAGVLSVTYEQRVSAPAPEAEKVCPRCAERVKAAAKVCRFCGHEFT
jgi:uncharacterized protein UPF0547